ncbi:MAG: NADP-dependent malic enzyme [Candidatus Micrarchaeota archaeon]|nr:NADP-dependent malic enzyme [Candidatus Micrarchaeota archaeon]
MAENIGRKAVELHRKSRGKLQVCPKVDCKSSRGLSLAYTPGVAEVCREIKKDPKQAYELTMKWNSVAVVSDGSRVLGLGNVGPLAALPVMEGKAALFKSYANIDAFPICLSCQKEEEIAFAVEAISPSFGGINLEDIESPKCFEVERRLMQKLDIPVFHDDQHGTAVVVLAGLMNALKLVGKSKKQARVVVLGAGAAGSAIAKLLSKDGFGEILVCDSRGIISQREDLPGHKLELAKLNRKNESGTLADALKGADVLVGASAPNILGEREIKSMAGSPIVFALSNPDPEISPQKAKRANVAVFGTARADLPNQINNVLGFPGIFRGALMARSRRISEGMMLAASRAIAGVLGEDEISKERVVPLAFDARVVPAVALSVAQASMQEGYARQKLSEKELKAELERLGLLNL